MNEKTLIIYDLNGVIINQIKGGYILPNGIPFLEVIIPENKIAVSVNVDLKEAVLIDKPKTEIEILQEENMLQEENISMLAYELMMIQQGEAITFVERNSYLKFKSIKIWYNKGLWTDDMVSDALAKGVINEAELAEIINK